MKKLILSLCLIQGSAFANFAHATDIEISSSEATCFKNDEHNRSNSSDGKLRLNKAVYNVDKTEILNIQKQIEQEYCQETPSCQGRTSIVEHSFPDLPKDQTHIVIENVSCANIHYFPKQVRGIVKECNYKILGGLPTPWGSTPRTKKYKAFCINNNYLIEMDNINSDDVQKVENILKQNLGKEIVMDYKKIESTEIPCGFLGLKFCSKKKVSEGEVVLRDLDNNVLFIQSRTSYFDLYGSWERED